MNLDTVVQYDINLYAAVFLLVIFFAMRYRRNSFNFSARLFRTMVVVNIGMLILEIFSWYFNGLPGDRNWYLNYATNWIFLWLSPLMVSLWASYIDYRLYGSRGRLRRRLYYAHPMIVSTIVMVITLFEPIVFSVTPDNFYVRHPYMWVNLGVSYVVLIYIAVMTLRQRQHIQGRLLTIMLLLVSIPAVGALVQMLFYSLLTIWSLMAMIMVLTFVFLENYNASIDHLTGLFNRIRVDEYVHGLMDSGVGFGIVIVDLDDFKAINDSYGHHEGDAALVLFANALREVFRTERMVGRFGGDEFIVVTRTVDPAELDALEARLVERVHHAVEQSACGFEISFSFGYAVHRSQGERSYDELFVAADQEMYLNKRKNRNLQRRAADRP